MDCNAVFSQVLQCAGNINYYDVRKQCNPAPLCYDFTAVGLSILNLRVSSITVELTLSLVNTQLYESTVD
jgi:hypothetical protein